MKPATRLRGFAERSRDIVISAAIVGTITGFIVAGCQKLTLRVLLVRVNELPLWLVACAPFVGLVLCALCLRFLARGASPGISDAYIESFHDPGYDIDEREAPGSTLASVVTLGLGGAMGLEGLALYVGGAIGTAFQKHFRRVFRPMDAKLLLVAGAAAGLAAVFKAPATGAVFALEVPYVDDLARRKLVPALVAAATGYLAYIVVEGPAPLFPVHGQPQLGTRAIVGAIVIGVVAGLAARAFAGLLQAAKAFARKTDPRVRAVVGGAAMAALFVTTRLLTGQNLSIGPGYGVLAWALEPGHAVLVVLAMLIVRCLATASTLAGGGAGGLFIPLVVAGALLGRAAAGVAGNGYDDTLFVVVGVSAFLGAGYRVPLAAVMFVAETTGRPAFVVPGLLAAVAANLMMGSASVADGQVGTRPAPG